MNLLKNFFSISVTLIFSFSFVKTENKSSSHFDQSVYVDARLPVLKIIRRHGYPSEFHKFQSEDGYTLGYYRIPHGKTSVTNRKPYPVILHHGLLSSSIDWIINGPKKSLGYRLADEGFDVWLANARGTPDSKSHTSMKPVQNNFWNFTFHEMGKYDVPAAINYILNITNKEKVIYIGHSLGTTIFYVFATMRPEMSDKILIHVSLAPTAMISHATSLFKMFVPWMKQIQSRGDWYRMGPFLEYSPAITSLAKYFCSPRSRLLNNPCTRFIPLITGRDDAQVQKEIYVMLINKFPSGTSVKNMVHCSQLLGSGEFAQFDYGKIGNLKIYGQSTAPKYDLNRIQIPMRLYYGYNDIISNSVDTLNLYQKLPKPAGCVLVPYQKWNHVDFLWAKDVNPLFNKELLQFLQNSTKNDNFIENLVAESIRERENRLLLSSNSSVSEVLKKKK